MGRKGKDLFQILEMRQKGNLPDNKRPGPRSRSGATAAPPGLWTALTSAIGSWTSGGSTPNGRRSAKGAAPASAGFSLSGPALAGVAFGCLMVGFLLGRALSPSPAEADLSVGNPLAENHLETPRELGVEPDGDRGWSAEREQEALSRSGFALVKYAASDRRAAAELAAALRERNFSTARIRRVEWDGKTSWLAVVYADSADERLRQRLVDMPGFANDDLNYQLRYARDNSQAWPVYLTFD